MTQKLTGTVESVLSYKIRKGAQQLGNFGHVWILTGEDGITLASGVEASRRKAKRQLRKAAAVVRKDTTPEEIEL